MILSETVKIKTNNQNYKKYITLGYTFNTGESIPVKIEHLSKRSKYDISVKCDVCGCEKSIKYYSYIQNISKYNLYTCNTKCSNIKFRKTCLERYGCEYPLQNKKIKENTKNYFLSKYGVTHPSMLDEFEKKKQNTNLERYGVTHQMYNIENIVKIKETKLAKYGNENYNNHNKSKETKLSKYNDVNYNNHIQCKETKLIKYDNEYYNNHELHKKNNLIKYGVENNYQVEHIKDKIKSNNLEKYGFKYYQSTIEYRQKYKTTCLEKYGVENPMQTKEIHNKQQSSAFKINYYNNLSYRGTYELDFIKFCENNSLKISKIDKIEYMFNNNVHYYFSDFYLEDYNLVCEIKSDYYYKLDESKNICKKEYTIKSGYNFLFIINKNYDDLKKIINL